jgi:predicted AAA+ superfamily ATPase
MSGPFFETYVISEIVKSYYNNGQIPPIYYYRDSNQNEIDLLFEENGTLFPIEIKKKSTITVKDIHSFNVLLSNRNVKIGPGGVICTIDKLSHIKDDFLAIPISYL